MALEQITDVRKGYVIRTDDGKYLIDNSGHEWGPQYIGTKLEHATVYSHSELTEWEFKRIKDQWGGGLTIVNVNVIKIITIVE